MEAALHSSELRLSLSPCPVILGRSIGISYHHTKAYLLPSTLVRRGVCRNGHANTTSGRLRR